VLKARLWLACLLSVAVPASVHPYFCVPVPAYVAAAEAVWLRVFFFSYPCLRLIGCAGFSLG
jgi:hypothetical protein